MKPTEDGKGTLIDGTGTAFWRRGCLRDINYGYSTSGGIRHTIGKSYTAPALVTYGEATGRVFWSSMGDCGTGRRSRKRKPPNRIPAWCRTGRGICCVRVWQGDNPASEGTKWSVESAVEQNDVTGERFAVLLR